MKKMPQSATSVLVGSITIFLMIAASVIAIGEPPRPQEIFVNKDCGRTASCALKKVWLKTEEYVLKADQNRGRFLTMGYETDTVDHLEDYGFVVFARGCVWVSQQEPDGTVTNGSCHPDWTSRWTIQSGLNDPFYRYMHTPDAPRHYYYRWNTVRGSTNYKTSKLYGEEKPGHPQLYIFYSPPTVFVFENGVAQNVSLEVNICLYKTADIPMSATRENADFSSAPIRCFERSMKYSFNHEKAKFEPHEDLIYPDAKASKP